MLKSADVALDPSKNGELFLDSCSSNCKIKWFNTASACAGSWCPAIFLEIIAGARRVEHHSNHCQKSKNFDIIATNLSHKKCEMNFYLPDLAVPVVFRLAKYI